MTTLVLYFVVSALIGLIIINWIALEPNCDCDLCQSPDAIAERDQFLNTLARLSWRRQALFGLIWSLLAIPIVCLAVVLVIVDALQIDNFKCQ